MSAYNQEYNKDNTISKILSGIYASRTEQKSLLL